MRSSLFNYLITGLLTLIILNSCSWDSEERVSRTYIVVTFDDQHHTIYDTALPILQEFGFRATNVINTGNIGKPGLLTWQQVEELEFVHGWETAGHTLEHPNLPDCTDEEALYQIEQDWLNLKERGLSHESFALPRGHATLRDYEIIKRFYRNIRNSMDKRMHYPIDRLNIGYFAYLTSYTADDVIRRIDEGIFNQESFIVIGFHRFHDTSHTHSCTAVDFLKIMQYIESLDLEVLTLKEAAALSL